MRENALQAFHSPGGKALSQTPSFEWAGVVAPHAAAATAARDILIEGGNAIEAAVAAAAATSVVVPDAGGAGGDGLWTIREAGARGRTRVLDARGPAGDAVTLQHFREREFETIPMLGSDAVLTVPGAVAGWLAALDLSRALGGRIPVGRLLEPAVVLAREGFPAQDPARRPLPVGLADMPGFGEAFLREGKRPAAGSPLRAVVWGETLGYLALSGLDDFYRGDVGREIVRDLRTLGGLLDRDDLRHFEPRWREPSRLRGRLGLLEAPPSRTALSFLLGVGLFEGLGSARAGSTEHLHRTVEATKLAQAMRTEAEESGLDPGALLIPARLTAESERIDVARAAAGGLSDPDPEAGIWIGVVDAQGLAVSLVGTLGTAFGSGCVLPKSGLLMGNRGACFTLDAATGPTLRRGRRAPMDGLPVVVTGDRGGVMSLGASSWSLAVGVVASLDAGSGLADAVETPRLLSRASPGSDGPVVVAEEGFDPSTLAALSRAGHDIRSLEPHGSGSAGAVRRLVGGRVEAAADPRLDAALAGF